MTAAAPDLRSVELPRVTATMRARRAARIATVAARHFVTLPLDLRRAPEGTDPGAVVGPRLRAAIVDLGATFVKLGQLLASSPTIAGEALAAELRGLLDTGPGVDPEAVRRLILEDTSRHPDELFDQLDERPFAAASLAAVYRGRLRDGTDVAVKVLRPGTAELVATDLALLRPLFRLLAKLAPVGVIAALPDTLEGLAAQLAEEFDLTNEARAMDWFRDMLGVVGADGVIVPPVHPRATGRRVLTMDFVSGHAVDDLRAVQLDADSRAAVERLLQAWFAVTLCTGTFHGDMHAGNLLLTGTGQVALLDWGIVGRLQGPAHTFLRRSIEGCLGDEAAWDDVRAHLMSMMGTDVARVLGVSEDDMFAMLRGQIEAIFNEPFDRLNLMALMPAVGIDDGSGAGPSTAGKGWRASLTLIRDERRRRREAGPFEAPGPDRGEMLLVKQLVYFERYGRMFLADRPLLWDPELYRTLLDLPPLVTSPS